MTTSAGTRTYNYDYEGRITSVVYPGSGGTDTNAYNGLSARVRRTDAATGTRNYLRDGLAPASDVLYDGSIQFTPGVSERNGVGQDRYYNDGALGSLTDMTDLNGNFLSQRKWDAYGNQTTTPSSYFRGWNEGAGYEEDSGSGLRLLGYRFYDPSVGRFLTQDPAGDGTNWYSYCGNDPVGEVDPSGLRARRVGDDWQYGDGSWRDARSDNIDNGWFFTPKNPVYEFVVGVGDGCTFGLTKILRAHMGTNDFVDENNGWHFVGELTGQTITEYLAGAWAGKIFDALRAGRGALRLGGAGTRASHWIRVENGAVHLFPGIDSSAVKVLHFHVNIGSISKLHLPYQLWPTVNGFRYGWWLAGGRGTVSPS